MSDRLSDLEWAFDENDFLTLFGDRYGYLGGIKRIRKQEFSRLEGNELFLQENSFEIALVHQQPTTVSRD